ncbi:MAG: PAS domain-containing protein [Desulfatiglandaceae bacterium]
MKDQSKSSNSGNPIPYRNVLSQIDLAVAVLSGGRIIFANSALCGITGKNRGDILGNLFLGLVNEKDRAVVEGYFKSLEVSVGGSISFRVIRESTADRDVSLKAFPLELQGVYADLPGICCCVTDVTDELDRIEELGRENRRLRSLIDDTESVVMSFAPYDYKDILLTNRYVEALLGCSMKEIMNGRVHLFDFVHPAYIDKVINFYKGFPDVNENECLEYVIISKDGKQKWVCDTGNALFIERGHGIPRRIDHTIVDITEQKKREIELEKERSKLESIIKNSTDMIYRVDHKGSFLELNPAGMQLLGIEGDPGQKNILDYYVDPGQRDLLVRQLEEKGRAHQTVKWRIPPGVTIDVVINAVAEVDDDTEKFSYQGIIHNVTKTLEMQKIESVKKMCGGLSDKINTPLMTLSMNMQMLRDMLHSSHLDAEEIAACLDGMEKAYARIIGPMQTVREKYWNIEEVADGVGGTIYEIHEKDPSGR